jgi:UDP-N-acetylmuramoylalanine--D-glutamate ligase
VDAPLAAVTGTKGKSTTSAALGAMLAEAGFDARVGGNIGRPLTGLLDGQTERTRYVLEVSSFQLEGCSDLHPRVAVFLNLSPDHLDRHPTFEAYAAAKARLFREQTPDDWAVVNGADAQVERQAAGTRARLVRFFGAGEAPVVGDAAWFADGAAWLRRGGRPERLFAVADARLPGAHLRADLLAAAAAARLMGAEPDAIARAVRAFRGLENVLEHVADLAGVAWFNDTKATNVDAARHSLLAFPGPLVAIMGGRFKGGDFATLRDVARGRVRLVLAIGEARPLLRAAFEGVVDVVECDSLRAAVEAAHAAARPGDTVLLAPGCSSFDMFRDYAERGAAFRAEVARLQDAAGRRDG